MNISEQKSQSKQGEDTQTQAGGQGRREFLCRVAGTAGSLTLGVAALGPAIAQEAAGQNAPNDSDDVVLKFKDHEALNQVGGSEIMETGDARVVVVHPDEATYAACSGICTHKGGKLAYDHASKQLVCPVHGARFDLKGNVVRGPARTPLQTFAADAAVVVEVKPAP